LCSVDGGDDNGWSVFMAWGSLASIPRVDHADFLADAAAMKPTESGGSTWMLSNPDKGIILYSRGNSSNLQVDLAKMAGMYNVRWINPADGHLIKEDKAVKGVGITELKSPKEGSVVVWLAKSKGS
jgi:hypothetical protein